MNKKIRMWVSYYEQHSERIIVAMVDTKPTPPAVVQVYMPTSSPHDEEIEKLYDNMKEVIQTVNGEENLIVKGDWNSVVLKGRERQMAAAYELGKEVVAC